MQGMRGKRQGRSRMPVVECQLRQDIMTEHHVTSKMGSSLATDGQALSGISTKEVTRNPAIRPEGSKPAVQKNQ